MPIYEEEGKLTRDDLLDLRKRNKCKECGARLDVFLDFDTGKAFLACADWPRSHHEGIEREASRYEQQGLAALNIATRREILNQEYGEAKTRALDKYIGVVSLNKVEAREILKAVYPDAPESEVIRAVLLCASYQLNPLMKHVFLLRFNKWNKGHTEVIGEEWATVLGIKAKRLLASRPDIRGQARPYSYVDNSPRVMTEQEQKTIFGEVEADKLWVITKGKDPATGAEAVGYGFWPKDTEPYGKEKGNTKFNMASIRSESQMLDRLRPGEMPVGVEVMPEEVAEVAVVEGEGVIEGEVKEISDKASKEADLGVCPIHKIGLVAGKGNFPPYCPTRVDGTGRSAGKKVWCKGKLPDAEVAEPMTSQPEQEAPAESKNGRDPETIKTITELFKACNEDWGLQPAQVLAELNANTKEDISERPADCYRRIALART